ncbi:hypothetical protein IFM89_031597 [Coptis chinensis]|uniref:G-patch domain-containing protein n=1 Tax=Coptis chinensis TaxID=261450 RepID=A0A835H7Z4_9MAGN|nr:hypothetical protein IFM89_031597 [Coptis chinensis]
MTKFQHMQKNYNFGVFADGTDESSSRKRRKKDVSTNKYDFTKPVNFVSSTTVMPNHETDCNNADDSRKEVKIGECNGLGLNCGLGLGSNSSKDEDASFLPIDFGRKIKEGAVRPEKSKVGKRENVDAGDVGVFEKHTKGIGSKILYKMGYKGGGLGKNQQGIVAPIEVKLRPKNMGMGFKDYKEMKSMPASKEYVEEMPKVLLDVSQSKEKLWSKQNRRKKKEMYVMSEVLLASKEEKSVDIVQTVIDMRGPQVRVLTNLENLHTGEKLKDSDTYLPELQHNIKLIVDLAEFDIQKLDRDSRNERAHVVYLQKEKEKLQRNSDMQRKQLDRLLDIAQVVERIEQENSLGMLTIDSLLESFGDLRRRHVDEYKLCNLACVASALGLPLLIGVFQGWDPLQHPLHGVKVMSSWKNLLEEDSHFDAPSPFTQLVMKVFLPAIRISGTNTWNPRDPEPMLKLLESWEMLLPVTVLETIVDNVVMPKLLCAVETCDPLKEDVSIHLWVHPWIPLLGKKLESLYRTVLFKLGTAIRGLKNPSESVVSAYLKPTDVFAYARLSYAKISPWKTVFGPASWEHLIERYVVQKLASTLQEFQVMPSIQEVAPFSWVMSWASVVPVNHMVAMLEVNFFPKWQQVLFQWLSSKPKFGEVSQWFLGWKGLLAEELLANARVGYHINVGLDMIEQAVEDKEVVHPGAVENIGYPKVTEKRKFDTHNKAADYAQQEDNMGGEVNMDGTGDMPVMSLKEAIEDFAQKNELLFMPKPGRTHNGFQIYGFGNISVYIDTLNYKIFAQAKECWSAVTLELLKEMHYCSGPLQH